MGKQSGVVKLPEAAGVVGHRVQRARDKVVAGVVAVRSLEKGVEAEEVSPCRGSGGSAFGCPSDSGPVIAVKPDGTFVHMALVCKNSFVRNRSGKLEIGNRQGPGAAGRGDQGGADGGRKRGAPHDRWGGAVVGVKPDAAHARPAGIASANVGGGKGNKFAEVCGATVEGVGKVAEVLGAVVDVTSEPDTVFVPATQGVLQDGEEAVGSRNGQGQRPEFAQQQLPLGDRHALARRAELVKEGIEAKEPMGGEFESFRDSVNNPPQHEFPVRPMGVPLLHFFEGSRGFPAVRVVGVEGAEDGIDGVEGIAQKADLFAPSLGSEKKVVDVNVHAGKRGSPDGGGLKGGGTVGPTREGKEAGAGGIRSRCLCNTLQWMNPRECKAASSGTIGQVTCGLGEGSEVRGALDPPHGQGQREGNERSPRGGVRQDDTQLGDIGSTEANAVEAVGNVDFGELGRPKPRVDVDEATEETGEGAAELHGLGRGKPDSVLIDPRVGVVNNQPRPALTLRHDAKRGEAKIGDAEGSGEGKHCPEVLLAEFKNFLADEFHLVASGLVRPSLDGAAKSLGSPGGRTKRNRSSPATQMIKEASRLVRKMADAGRNIGGAAERGDECLP